MERADQRLVRSMGKRATYCFTLRAESRWDRQHAWTRARVADQRGYARPSPAFVGLMEFVPDDGEMAAYPLHAVQLAVSHSKDAKAARATARRKRAWKERRAARA